MAKTRFDEEIIRQKLVLFADPYPQRNSLSLIFRLPTEILVTIFINYARDYHYAYAGYFTPTAPSWVNVSYVCRHWRDVALNCSTLWTYVSTTSQRWTEELLVRSKQALLKIWVQLHPGEEPLQALCLVEQVMNHVERIQEFSLIIPFTCNAYQFFSKLSSRASRLQHLVISVESVSPEWSSVLFHGDTPALRTLELFHSPVPWYLFNLSGLTTLTLYAVPVRFRQNMVEFLAMLRRMQNLTHLHLEEALASASGFLPYSGSNTSQKINLPHLSRLLISAPLSTVIAFLSCVNIPFEGKVELRCSSEPDSSLKDYTQLSSLLAPRFSTSDDLALSVPTIRSLIIQTQSESHSVIFSASERGCDSPLQPIEWDFPLKVYLCGSIILRNKDRIISGIFCSIPSTNVQSIHFIEPPFSPDLWRKILGHLRGLRYIKLSQGRMPDIASVLSVDPHDYTENQNGHSDRGSNQIFAPALEELELYDIRLLREPGVESNMVAPAADLQSLYDALSTRHKPRGRLTITRCRVFGNDGEKPLDLVGRWEGGHFHVVDERSDSDTSWRTIPEYNMIEPDHVRAT